MAAAMTARHIKTDSKNYPFVITSLQVLDSSDEPYKDLTEKNFKLAVDTKTVDSLKVTTYEKTGEGLYIMLCIDASGTMRGEPIEAIKKAILPFIDKIRSVDKIAISVYADDYQLLADFTNSKQLLKNTVNNITPKGNFTSLYYGSYKALDELIKVEDRAGKIMVLMGDGKDENPTGSYKENDVIDAAKKNSIPIFTIGYTKMTEIYLQSLERMAESTGGNYYYAPSSDDLKNYYEKLYRQIMNINLLSYMVVGIAGDGNEHNLGIVVKTDQDSQELSAKIKTPAGVQAYNPPTPQTTKPKFNPLLLIIIAGILVVLTAAIFLILNYNKKQKRLREDEIRSLEARKNSELEAERQKREALEREKQQQQQGPFEERTLLGQQRKPIESSKDRTMILGATQTATTKSEQARGTLRLEVLFGANQGKVFNIDKSGATIGRAGDNNIVFADKTVSSHHARISYVDGFYVIEDLGSLNGTYIDGNKTQIYRIENSCTFKLGSEEGNITII